ncbi:NAD(P)H-dependent oxidoreductase [Candidatus Magnetomonas plexicatena]|uniref:NAD(P)H-dependent oxidoreductase n=1 Tax=Candidatus Magnetomonas plexicatena TaxID=2552947 RepID=UPI0011056996|nr:NAD(P)H-dependent oxidoreductase [Nitrospirales bacterium LBB_01]
MKILLVYSHPNPGSFNHAIKETIASELTVCGHDVKVRDLYAIGFDPVLKSTDFLLAQQGKVADDVKLEQDFIVWSDMVVFVHPVWWASMPAILKGYIDRVFTHGFAYAIDENGLRGLLSGKKAIILSTTGADEKTYTDTGMFKSIKLAIDGGIFAFCGFEVIEHKFLTSVPYVSGEERKKMLEQVVAVARTLAVN